MVRKVRSVGAANRLMFRSISRPMFEPLRQVDVDFQLALIEELRGKVSSKRKVLDWMR